MFSWAWVLACFQKRVYCESVLRGWCAGYTCVFGVAPRFLSLCLSHASTCETVLIAAGPGLCDLL